jgi:hypothetical protein
MLRTARSDADAVEALGQPRDRLVTTLFLAAIVHGILILGVTFTADSRRAPRAPGLDVQLLAEDAPDESRDRPAAYLVSARARRATGWTPGRRWVQRRRPRSPMRPRGRRTAMTACRRSCRSSLDRENA